MRTRIQLDQAAARWRPSICSLGGMLWLAMAAAQATQAVPQPGVQAELATPHTVTQTTDGCRGSAAGLLERPSVQVGDRWAFRTTLVGGRRPLLLQHEVASVDAQVGFTVAVRSDRMAPEDPALLHRFDVDFNRLSREVVPGESIHYAPAFPMFRFPMRAGMNWQTEVRQQQTGEPGSAAVQVSARVLGCEEVTVPAGRFHAWRIEAVYQTADHRVQSRYWYAPQAKRSVRGEEVTSGPRGRSELTYELVSLEIAR